MHSEISVSDNKTRIFRLRLILVIFWVVVLVKCVLAQWAIVTYDIPINGWLYVWTPTCVLGIVCTVIYSRYFGLCLFQCGVRSHRLRDTDPTERG